MAVPLQQKDTDGKGRMSQRHLLDKWQRKGKGKGPSQQSYIRRRNMDEEIEKEHRKSSVKQSLSKFLEGEDVPLPTKDRHSKRRSANSRASKRSYTSHSPSKSKRKHRERIDTKDSPARKSIALNDKKRQHVLKDRKSSASPKGTLEAVLVPATIKVKSPRNKRPRSSRPKKPKGYRSDRSAHSKGTVSVSSSTKSPNEKRKKKSRRSRSIASPQSQTEGIRAAAVGKMVSPQSCTSSTSITLGANRTLPSAPFLDDSSHVDSAPPPQLSSGRRKSPRSPIGETKLRVRAARCQLNLSLHRDSEHDQSIEPQEESDERKHQKEKWKKQTKAKLAGFSEELERSLHERDTPSPYLHHQKRRRRRRSSKDGRKFEQHAMETDSDTLNDLSFSSIQQSLTESVSERSTAKQSLRDFYAGLAGGPSPVGKQHATKLSSTTKSKLMAPMLETDEKRKGSRSPKTRKSSTLRTSLQRLGAMKSSASDSVSSPVANTKKENKLDLSMLPHLSPQQPPRVKHGQSHSSQELVAPLSPSASHKLLGYLSPGGRRKRRSSPYKNLSPGQPGTDLDVFLQHVSVLNDMRTLFGTHVTAGCPEMTVPALPDNLQTCSPGTRRRVFFQLRCVLQNVSDNTMSSQELASKWDLSAEDVTFVVEHILLAQDQGVEVRWDLINSIILPDMARETSRASPRSSVQGNMSSNNSASEAFWTSISDDSTNWRSSASLSLGNSLAEVSYVDEASIALKRETYQEVVLELYEETEGRMGELSPSDIQTRRLILVELLQATSEDECHLTSLTLDDVAEIVHHASLCHETKTPVQWTMIQDIVFPMSTMRDPQRPVGKASVQIGVNDMEVDDDKSIEVPDESSNWCVKALSGEQGIHEFRERFALTEDELDTVLGHINSCKSNDSSIRWDLIGEVLFPGDKQSTDIMASSVSSLSFHDHQEYNSSDRMTKSASNLGYFHTSTD